VGAWVGPQNSEPFSKGCGTKNDLALKSSDELKSRGEGGVAFNRGRGRNAGGWVAKEGGREVEGGVVRPSNFIYSNYSVVIFER